ncbi:restriction endonuclease [Rhodohalobacter sp.]|uniref:restriction endonuclease n=1 Tax=Rhodohalobacter sp. TaxID=1974210 RepID=UPI002ACD6BB5|nr:restriction endonuclease [Rhodohalobacter sp.]MDZ7755841.1 restriction endonuclease [Rhodohalobacter sp.]
MAPVHVTKYSGETEAYDESKLRHSLKSAGADSALIDYIAEQIQDMLYDGISTQKIYKEAFRILKSESQRSAGRYKLKEALFELGPSGFPFERFIAELLNRLGYQTEVGVVVQGDCVSHEIDVIAQKDDSYLLVECKFHNRNEHRCNVKVPLYIQSRFQDVKRNWSSLPGHKNKTHKGWVVTNTRFTSDAEKYGTCIGLELLSWDFPRNNGIKDLVSRLNLHPVTCLSSLTKEEKSQLLKHNIIFCRQICEDKNRMKSAGINPRNVNKIAKEAEEICNHGR